MSESGAAGISSCFAPTLAAGQLRSWAIAHEITRAAVEAASSYAEQGVRSAFTFGRSFREWLGILAALGIPHVLVTPQQWQHGLVRPPDGADQKSRSLTVARRLFPDIDLSRKKDHHRSDALLLAYWAKQGGTR
jgi:crossover junction endodeoxyribonuclease RuvC